MGEEVKLFRTWSSGYALRIVWALKLKGVEFETIYEDLSNKSEALIKYNPVHKKVPVLVHNNKPISESLVILEYIDETWTARNPLFPSDPLQRAKARFLVKFGDDKVVESIWGAFIMQGKERDESHSMAKENLKSLEAELKGKKFFGGEEIGILDIAFGWLANLVSVFEEISGQKLIEEEDFPLLCVWMQVFADNPVIKENWPPRDRLVTKYRALRDAYLSKQAP